MPKIIRNEIEYSSTTSTANQISYLNTTSGLSANNVQGAIDEVVDDLEDKADRVPEPAEYDPTATYTTGDFCTHAGDIYQATNTTTGTWNSNVWTLRTSQQDYLHSINPVGSGSFSLNRKSGTTVGDNSFAEGSDVTASGGASHAEGCRTISSGVFSHAEGFTTTASGWYGSHAEGSYTTAGGHYSHAEGYYTRANHASQHVFGEYNVADPSTASASDRGNYVEIVGNGTYYNARSNARTLDWSGNEVLSGSLTATQINGTLPYDNTSSGLSATNVQDAIDEVVSGKADKSDIAITPITNLNYNQTNVSAFTYGCQKYGRLVVLNIASIRIARAIGAMDEELATGLPIPIDDMNRLTIIDPDTNKSYRVRVTTNGKLVCWYNSSTIPVNAACFGTLIYLSAN